MKIKIRSDSVEISGYVNAVERLSKPLWSRIGEFVERICAGAFKKALNRANDVHILLNHDWNRDLGSIRRGNLELEEDSIGLHARATITDPEVVEKARAGKLRGWSFGFNDREVENGIEDGRLLRKVHDLDLLEVSILDDRKTPAYAGTLITARSVDGKEEIHFRGEDFVDNEIDVVNENPENVNKRAPKERDEEDESDGPENNEDGGESQEKNTPNIEKNANVNYNVYKDIIKDMKEDK